MQVVGGPNSTDEGMNKINTRGKSKTLGVRPHKEKINISEEFINKGSGSSLRCC